MANTQFTKFIDVPEAVATSYLYGKMLMDADLYPVVQKLTDAERLAYIKGIEIVQLALADEVMGYC